MVWRSCGGGVTITNCSEIEKWRHPRSNKVGNHPSGDELLQRGFDIEAERMNNDNDYTNMARRETYASAARSHGYL
jgi:hypothetical protein